MGAAYLSIKSINKGTNHPHTALRHNMRAIQAELGADSHIAPYRTHLNQVIYGKRTAKSANELRCRILQRLKLTKPRTNAVHAIEVVISLPVDQKINQLGFFLCARDWIKAHYGGLMLHAVIHNDEDAPHMHALILPIVNKKLQGNALKGNRTRMMNLQSDFYREVCAPFGLEKPQSKLNTNTQKQMAQAVIREIECKPNVWWECDFQEAVKSLIYKNPIAFLKPVGLLPNRKPNDFIKIMTQPVKPESKRTANTITV